MGNQLFWKYFFVFQSFQHIMPVIVTFMRKGRSSCSFIVSCFAGFSSKTVFSSVSPSMGLPTMQIRLLVPSGNRLQKGLVLCPRTQKIHRACFAVCRSIHFGEFSVLLLTLTVCIKPEPYDCVFLEFLVSYYKNVLILPSGQVPAAFRLCRDLNDSRVIFMQFYPAIACTATGIG